MMMKRKLNFIVAVTACVIGLTACGWKPPCPPTKITEPWTKMNLPLPQDSAVCTSSADKFQADYKAGREEVTKMYLDALEKGGWKTTRRDLGDMYYFDFDKGSDKITLQIYDWQKTGVLIKRR
jgi:hypothetical protein